VHQAINHNKACVRRPIIVGAGVCVITFWRRSLFTALAFIIEREEMVYDYCICDAILISVLMSVVFDDVICTMFDDVICITFDDVICTTFDDVICDFIAVLCYINLLIDELYVTVVAL